MDFPLFKSLLFMWSFTLYRLIQISFTETGKLSLMQSAEVTSEYMATRGHRLVRSDVHRNTEE